MNLTFQECQKLIKTGRDGRKKLDHNTYLVQPNNDCFAVKLHDTLIVKINQNNTYTLDCGKWQTVTTKNRINNFSPARLFQKSGEWFLAVSKDWESVPFFNGITINSKGEVV